MATGEQTIPVVDLLHFTDGDAADQGRFVEALGNSLVEYGFVAVENHRLDPVALKATYTSIKSFFELPTDVKCSYEDRKGGNQRGYTSFGREHAKQTAVADLKEFWHVGLEFAADDPLAKRMPPNIWPSELPIFKASALTLFDSFGSVSQTLLRAIARFLDADENEFARMTVGGNSILRMIRYPGPDEVVAEEGAVWAAEHEDINLITLLPEATEPGLQLLDRNGKWLPIAPVKGQVVADSGDMLQRLTNGLIPSTTHRVLAPPNANGPRYSMPYFQHPHPDVMLTPVAGTVTAERPRQWDDITADDYLWKRLREIGLSTED